jgi:hypothetical protein
MEGTMKGFFLRSVACLLVVGLLISSSGCFGSFTLTKKVYKFNQEVGDKWVNELVFLVMIIVPVYSIASLLDAVILNSIEFWTGKNPMSGEAKVFEDPGNGTTAYLDLRTGSLRYIQNSGQTAAEYVFERTSDGTNVRDAEGNLLFVCKARTDGGITLSRQDGSVISSYTVGDLEAFTEALQVH